MSDESYKHARAELALIKAVSADSRVIAADSARQAFYASEWGQIILGLRGREAWAAADEELKDVYEAFGYNWAMTRKAVRAELRPQFHPEEA